MSDVDLPAGQTCNDCLWFRRCEMLFGCKPESTWCDFSPSRFRPTWPTPKDETHEDETPDLPRLR